MKHHTLDARKMLCPMPVIKTQNFVASLDQGDTVDVICSDPGAMNDIPAWCRINGHEIIKADDSESDIIITVKVGS